MTLLEVHDLRLSFGGVIALDGASLAVEVGRITGLIGPNGAGKTTLFNVVSGALKPESGRIRFNGTDVTGWRPEQLSRAGLARTFQVARGLPGMTLLENLMLYGKDQPGERFVRAIVPSVAAQERETELRQRALDVARMLDLLPLGDSRAQDLSGGQKKLLELGRVLMANPKLVLLDEPAAGVNPTLARRLAGHIRDLQRHGLTFLVVEHNMGLVAELCDDVVVLSQGKRLASGSFEEVRSDRRVQEAYLGFRS
jgi:ABC-type branched-subunit amino acid transport system ATPase component